MPSEFAKLLLKAFVKVYPYSPPVLDVGSGDVSYWYSPFFEGKEFKTLDPDPKYKELVDFKMDVCSMPHSLNNSFGVVLLFETLEHLPSPTCAFKSIFRVLKPGGYLLVSTVACYFMHRHPKDYWRFLPDGLELLCNNAGFINKGIKLHQPNTSKTCWIFLVAQKPL